MIFRFSGKLPIGNFEFTCLCGRWNKFYLLDGRSYHEIQTFTCEGCKRSIGLWQQITHWHLKTMEG